MDADQLTDDLKAGHAADRPVISSIKHRRTLNSSVDEFMNDRNLPA